MKTGVMDGIRPSRPFRYVARLLPLQKMLTIPKASRDPAPFSSYHQDSRTSPSMHRSPTNIHFPQHSPTYSSSHAHPSSRHNSIPQSPARSVLESPVLSQNQPAPPQSLHISYNMSDTRATPHNEDKPQNTQNSAESKPIRTTDPMSFSSILSSHPADPPKPTIQALPAVKQFQRKSHTPNGDTTSSTSHKKMSQSPALPLPNENLTSRKPVKAKTQARPTAKNTPSIPKIFAHNNSDKENEKVKKEIERLDAVELCDIDSSTLAAKKEEHALMGQKRQLNVDSIEDSKRKVSWTLLLQ